MSIYKCKKKLLLRERLLDHLVTPSSLLKKQMTESPCQKLQKITMVDKLGTIFSFY